MYNLFRRLRIYITADHLGRNYLSGLFYFYRRQNYGRRLQRF